METFTARTPVDLLALVPILIGFHPDDSVVLLTFHGASGDHSFHARVDPPQDEVGHRAVADMLVKVVGKHEVRTVAVLLYTDHPERAAGFAAVLVPDLLTQGVEVVDALRVADGR